MDRETVRQLRGLGANAASIAYKYLCNGFGQYQIEAGDVRRLPEGVVEAVVREFTPFGEIDPEVGHVDVVFTGRDGVEVCYHEFRVKVIGRGGLV